MKKYLLLFSIILLCVIAASAQDKIYKKGGEVLEVKILEVSQDEIKYKLLNNDSSPIYIIDKDRILKVVYEGGRIETFQGTLNDPEFYIGQKKNTLKINFLSPLLGYTQFAYEHSLEPGRSMELSLGIIGLGKNQRIDIWTSNSADNYKNQKGVFASFGYKFIKQPDFKYRSEKYSHILQGSYIKPEVMVGTFKTNTKTPVEFPTSSGKYYSIDRKTISYGGVIINLGKQWIFSDVFVLDIYFGGGYNFNNQKSTDNIYGYEEYESQHYGMQATTAGSGVGFTGGLRIGYLFK